MGRRFRVIVALAILALLSALTATSAHARPRLSDWTVLDPNPLGPLNTSAEEQQPAISKNGLALYFASDRTGGAGGLDIWVSHRTSTAAGWGAPMALGAAINTTTAEASPALSGDGHWLFFSALSRPGGSGLADLWASYRPHTHEDFGDFGWQPAVPLSSVNTTTFNELAPSYFQDDETGAAVLFFQSNRTGGLGAADIWMATQQPDGSFGAVTNVTALNTSLGEQRPTISRDGLEIFFMSNRAGGLSHIWTATRESTTSAWSTPTEVTSLKSAGSDQYPYLSSDGQTLYFGRSAGVGAPGDLYVATRTKETGKP